MLTRWLEVDPELESRRRESVDWDVKDALLALVVAQVAGLLGSVAILVSAGYSTPEEIESAPLWLLLLTQVPLWLGYGGVTLWATTRKGHGPIVDLGWRFRWPDVPFGLVSGALVQLVAVPVLYIPIRLLAPDQDLSEPARELADRATEPLSVLMLLLITVVGAPVIEELFFRGLLLRSLERRFGSLTAIVGSSVVFGAVHLQWLQLPALVLFGAFCAWLTLRSGRLGPAIWAHVGFNLVTVVVLLLVD